MSVKWNFVQDSFSSAQNSNCYQYISWLSWNDDENILLQIYVL
jgi:hypothetical protein